MIYNDTQAKAADAALAALLAAGSAMPKDSFCAAMYKVTDDHWLHDEVLNLLETDGFIFFEGTYGWRVRLTQEGCKAASKGVLAYLKHKRLLPCSAYCSIGCIQRNSCHYAVEHSTDDSDNGRYRRDDVASFFVHIC